jgi:DNA polymerase elongation subunit (family B)
MYQNIYYDRNTNLIHLWDDTRGYLKFAYNRYGYKKADNGKFTALDGTRLQKVQRWSKEDEAAGSMYESDLRPEMRTLIDMYLDSDDISTNHRNLFIDIEVSSEGGHATTKNVKNEITAISMYQQADDKFYTLLLNPEGNLKDFKKDKVQVLVYETEDELLQSFYSLYTNYQPTIITGWNIDGYDIPYIYNRTNMVLGETYANLLSPIEIVETDKFGIVKIAGVACLDYLALYKLYTYSEESSYRLEAIARKELGRGKVEYEGSLDQLYKTDIDKFIDYNVCDVQLIIDLDKKLQFIQQAMGVAHKGHVPYGDVYKSTRFLDGACITFIKRRGLVVPNINRTVTAVSEEDQSESGGDFEGAYVKIPVPGRYIWVYDIDMSALYPSVIRLLNISPETKVGRVSNWDSIKTHFVNGTTSTERVIIPGISLNIKAHELRDWLISNTYSISSIGVIYDMKKPGIVPTILTTWMQERDDYRALSKQFGKSGDIDKRNFYESRQLTMKIINNSLYGVLGNRGFRFYDLDNAESITTTGKSALMNHAEPRANRWYLEKLGITGDNVIYVDTDSVFCSALPVINHMESVMNRELSYEEKRDATYKTAISVEQYINDTFTEHTMLHHNVKNNILTIKQEYVSEAAFWVTKKRYAQKIVLEKGVSIENITNGKSKWKLDVKGMDSVRSDFPKAFRKFMSEMLILILDGVDRNVLDTKINEMYEAMNSVELFDIMFPTGVKEISKYPSPGLFQRSKGTPAHAKAALNYNDFITMIQSTALPFNDGDKIMWCYLKPNKFGLQNIALRGYEDPIEIVKFVNEFIDRESIFESALFNKLNDFYSALKFGEITLNNNVNEFFSFN